MNLVFEVNESTFEREVLMSELPVLVDLYADWCAPCKQLSPIVEEVAKEYEGKLKVAKVDVDKNPMLAQMFQARSIPMLVLVNEGQIAGAKAGLMDKKTLQQFIAPVLPKPAGEIKPSDLAQLIAANRAVAVDIRDASAYLRYRIPGAVHIAADQIAGQKEQLLARDGRMRVLYGRSTDEAKELCETMKKQGVGLGYLAGGFLHWEADGLEVERGTASE